MKPRIFVVSPDTADTFEWLSDGWYQIKQRGTKKAEALKKRTDKCIKAGKDVPDVIKLLRKAGFTVVRGKPDYLP